MLPARPVEPPVDDVSFGGEESLGACTNLAEDERGRGDCDRRDRDPVAGGHRRRIFFSASLNSPPMMRSAMLRALLSSS